MRVLLALGALLALSSPAAAVSWSPIERSVYARANRIAPDPHEVKTAEGVGTDPFDVTLLATADSPDGDSWWWYGRARASQSSTFDANSVETEIWVGASGGGDSGGIGARAESRMETAFSLATQAEFLLDGTYMGVWGEAPLAFELVLSGPSGVIASVAVENWSFQDYVTVPFAFAGLLEPGDYELLVYAWSNCSCPESGFGVPPNEIRADVSLSLTAIPEPGTLALLGLGLAVLSTWVRAPRRTCDG